MPQQFCFLEGIVTIYTNLVPTFVAMCKVHKTDQTKDVSTKIAYI